MTDWMKLVMEMKKNKHNKCSLKEAMMNAKAVYKK